MEKLTQNDRARLRSLAERHLTMANSPENEIILKKWRDLGEGKKTVPTVRLLFSNFRDEVVFSRLQCEGEYARWIEAALLTGMVGRELFGDDTPLEPYFDIPMPGRVQPFGIEPKKIMSKNGKGFHIEPVVEDLEADLEKLRGGSFVIDMPWAERRKAFVDEVFGDLLPARFTQSSLTGAITGPLVMLMNMENFYLAMYDTPDELKEAMDMATRVYEAYYDHLEANHLLLPTKDVCYVAQESFAFNHELPRDQAEKTTDIWGFLESQETTAVSPETYGEFVFPYQDRLVKRFGLLSYGCCERVDAIWPDYLSKWKNLRKLSVSPFNNEQQVGEYLRGGNVVYYSKPRAEYVTNPGPMDEDALKKYFKGVCEAASGCLFEIAQREVGTIFGDFERGRRYVQILRECVERYWKP